MFKRSKHYSTLLSALVLGVSLGLFPSLSFAQSSLLNQADKQILGKKFKAAARTITKAMNSGDLSKAQMAKALYRRGVAFNGSGRYSSAIADLTGALWLGKLGGAALKDAYRQRAVAYEATGQKKLARQDFGKGGQRLPNIANRDRKPNIVQSSLPIPSFNTVVRAVRKTTPPPAPTPRAKIAPKPVVAKKAAIPAFRTSIATE